MPGSCRRAQGALELRVYERALGDRICARDELEHAVWERGSPPVAGYAGCVRGAGRGGSRNGSPRLVICVTICVVQKSSVASVLK